MSESGEKNASGWSTKQTWIKDVLSKSGTELLKISTNKNGNCKTKMHAQNMKTNGNVKKNVDKKELNSKMVYYQSTPLIVKTEQTSQVQFCTPASSTSATTTTPPPTTNLTQYYQGTHEQQKSLNYSGFNGVRAEIVPQQHEQQQSINNVQLQTLNNIKLELLPPGITLYAKNATPQTTTTTTINTPTNSTFTTLTNVSTSINVAKTTTGNGRRATNPGNKPQFKCEQCGMIFGSKSAHTSHTKSHAKSNALTNATKDANNITVYNGATDINDVNMPLGIPKTPQIKPFANGVSSGDPYQCNVCQKTFAVPARLIRHYRTHTGERPFECEFCHKLFSVKENLQVHRRIHTKERPYKCDVCGRAFEHSGKLHRHMRIHTGERPHKCNVCEKTFIQSGQLVIHMRTHTGEKPYKCPVEGCGKGFTCSKQLKVHSRTHTGEKPYHCDICFRDFGYNHVLKLHRVQHYGSKCYKCTICDETFKSKKEMEAHIKGHANELPDDEDESSVNATHATSVNATSSSASICSASSTNSVSSSGEINSAPGSPLSPKTSSNTRAIKQRKLKVAKIEVRTPSPSSPSSTMSPLSSMASVTRLSASSPIENFSPQHNETDQYSRDSGLANSGMSAASQHLKLTVNNNDFVNYAQSQQQHKQMIDSYAEELPTDLSIPHQVNNLPATVTTTMHQDSKYYQPQTPHTIGQSNYSIYEPNSTYMRISPTPNLYEEVEQTEQRNISPTQMPTINPALLEAASIASRRAMLFDAREEEVTQAALQIMQLNRSQQPIHIQASSSTVTVSALSPSQQYILANSDTAQYDDTTEANELIDRYKRGDLAAHGIHKRSAPVPKFESSFLNNDMLVRQVEAAIAPLRSSTESPERSSSPESDSMLMADRDAMTLPLRKRKLRPLTPTNLTNGNANNKDQPNTGNGLVGAGVSTEPKVMRLNSVIQFAKAS